MAGWPENLEAILKRVTHEFGISRILNPGRLQAAQQTGFVWTRRPGVVCQAANRHYLGLALANPDARVIITTEAIAQRAPETPDCCLILCEQVEDLYLYLHIHQQFGQGADVQTVDPAAIVDSSAVLRGDVTIEAGAWIGPRVVLSGPVVVGRDAHIEASAVIGCEGLYAKNVAGTRCHIPHFGGVLIGPNAYIHAGAVVVRSAVHGENTSIGASAHIGVMANLGHDVQVGERATISSNVVVAGRASVGKDVWLGASVTVSNAVHIGDGAKVRIGSAVVKDVPAGADVSSGNFALDHAQAIRAYTKECSREK